MARLLRAPNLPSSLSPSTHLAGGLFAFAAVSCVVWMVSFMCASHHDHQPKTTKWRRLSKVRSMLGAGEGRLREWGSDQSSKALLKMVSWMRLQQEKCGGEEEDGEGDGDDDDHHEEEAIWKKTIIMGQRCRPLEFSEKVVSDDSKSHLLPG